VEASERDQLDLHDAGSRGGAGEAPSGSVRALDDRLVVESLTVADARAARVVRERAEAGHDPVRTVADAIEVGARVLDREGLEADVDFVRAEFERVAGSLHERWGEQARGVIETLQGELEAAFAPEGGKVAQAIDAQVDELAEQIARNFDGERATAVQHQVRELVSKAVEERMQSLLKHLSSEDGSNPLADFKASVNRTVVEAVRRLEEEEGATRKRLEGLHTEVTKLTEQTRAAEQLAEAEEAGTRKGRGFEERVHEGIEAIADARGDVAHHTGHEASEGGGKKGDSIVELGATSGAASGRIVFEAKNKRLSRQDAWRELNAALEQRGADFAVLVVAGLERVPAQRQVLHEYEGNKMVVAVDPEDPAGIELEVAYRLAVARVRMASDASLRLDAAGVRDAAEAARKTLEEAQRIRRALSGAQAGIGTARDGLDGMTAAMGAHLERIEALLAGSDG
jgi:hypothetical protein